jgi:hypothetical protein
MGLSMYLLKCPKSFFDRKTEPEFEDDLYEAFHGPWVGEKNGENAIIERMYDWYSEYQIAEWFIRNTTQIQVDIPCMEMSKNKLLELLDVCKEILRLGINSDGSPNAKVCHEILGLPGSPDDDYFKDYLEYDDWFLKEIKSTARALRKTLKTTNFETETIFFWGAW